MSGAPITLMTSGLRTDATALGFNYMSSNTVATFQLSHGIFGTTIYLRAVLASLERLSDALKALA